MLLCYAGYLAAVLFWAVPPAAPPALLWYEVVAVTITKMRGGIL